MAGEAIWALGLMSGTSMDGIDAAIIRTDGETISAFGPSTTVAYDPVLRADIEASLGEQSPDPALARSITEAHARCVQAILSQNPDYKQKIALVGLHGHTVLHRPEEGVTVQVGDGGLLAATVGADVVCDFRSADVAAGGEGAPFAPLYHRALSRDLQRPLAVLNIGGVANVTWIGADDDADPIAFDTGPGNGLLDQWVAGTTGAPFDRDGKVSSAGQVDTEVLSRLMANPYFDATPPKSLDRLDFTIDGVSGLSAEDGAATLARFTCEAIAAGRDHLPAPPRRWVVTGGGRKNPTLMQGLAEALNAPVVPVEDIGWDGDALEAQAFAFLAVRSLYGLPLSVPGTTGVPEPITGGRLSRAPT